MQKTVIPVEFHHYPGTYHAFDVIVDHVVPGRSRVARPANDGERRTTMRGGCRLLPFAARLPLAAAGLLFFFAVGAATELSVFMAGWSSRNKYALLGGMRAVAQMVSYEIPLILSTVTVVMMAGTLSPVKIIEAQAGHGGGKAVQRAQQALHRGPRRRPRSPRLYAATVD